MLHTGSMVVHWVVCCLTALGFNLKLRLLCGVLEETHVFAGFLQSLWIPPTLQKHAGKYTSSVCVFPPRAHCSHDGLQDKAVAKDEELHGMQENVIYKFIYSFRLMYMCFNVNYAKKGLLYPSILSWAERFSRVSLWLLCSKSCAVASSCS